MMINLPEWRLTLCAPLYDTASKSPIEMTAQVYAKMRELVNNYNEFVTQIEKALNNHTINTIKDIDDFKKEVTSLMQEYIKSIDTKIDVLNQDIEDRFTELNKTIEELSLRLNEAVIAYNEATEEIVIGGTT